MTELVNAKTRNAGLTQIINAHNEHAKMITAMGGKVTDILVSLGVCPACSYELGTGTVQTSEGKVRIKCTNHPCPFEAEFPEADLKRIRSIIKKTVDNSFIGRILRG